MLEVFLAMVASDGAINSTSHIYGKKMEKKEHTEDRRWDLFKLNSLLASMSLFIVLGKKKMAYLTI